MRDWKEETQKIITWMRKKVEEAKAQGLVLGMSGGIDSSVVAVLAQKALGEKSLGIMMPCYSIPQDLEDALKVAQMFSIPHRVIPLEKPYDAFLEVLGEKQENSRSLALANLKPRLRMCTLYYFANRLNYLVCGASNRSEITVGYFTKSGDGGVDILPIAHLTKTEVIELARFLNLPSFIITKPPSAGLWEGQTDEEEMGITYEKIDEFILHKKVEEPYLSQIKSKIRASEHKRKMPATPEEITI